MREEGNRDHHVGKWAIWTCVVLVGYILSIGPASVVDSFFGNKGIGHKTLRLFYKPWRFLVVSLSGDTVDVMVFEYELWWSSLGPWPPFDPFAQNLYRSYPSDF